MTRSGGARRPGANAVAFGTAAAVIAFLPVFVLSAMVVQIREDLAFSAAGLGLAVGAFKGTAALLSAPLGTKVDGWGAVVSLRTAATLTLVSSLGVALFARSLTTLALWMALGGAAGVLAQPAANALIVRSVAMQRRATAFGIKQSAPPLSGMIAGVAVPAIALTLGWRSTFIVIAVSAALYLALLRSRDTVGVAQMQRDPSAPLGRRPLLIKLMIAFALSEIANSTTTTFLVASTVQAGLGPSLAGVLFAVASLGAVATRLVMGVVADRMVGGHLRACRTLLLGGALGLVLLSTGEPALMTVGAILGFSGTWGLNGVFWFAVVSTYPDSPGRITGLIGPAGLIASSVSPFVMGALADAFGFRPVWLATAAFAVIAGMAMTAADEELRRSNLA